MFFKIGDKVKVKKDYLDYRETEHGDFYVDYNMKNIIGTVVCFSYDNPPHEMIGIVVDEKYEDNESLHFLSGNIDRPVGYWFIEPMLTKINDYSVSLL